MCYMGLCIPWPFAWAPTLPWPSALTSAPIPCPWLPICIYWPRPPISMYWSWPPICISRPWPPICIYKLWPQIFICRSWPTILLPVRALTLHIPTLSFQFVFVFTVLAHDLYYRSGAWIRIYLIIGSSSSSSSGSSDSSSNFFGIDNVNISMPILVK